MDYWMNFLSLPPVEMLLEAIIFCSIFYILNCFIKLLVEVLIALGEVVYEIYQSCVRGVKAVKRSFSLWFDDLKIGLTLLYK